MSNTERPTKRRRQETLDPRSNPRVYRDRIPLEDDYEVVQARTSTLSGQGRLPTDSIRSSLKGRTTWTVGTSWAPEDDPELDLDPSDDWYDEAMGADVGDILDDHLHHHTAKQRGRRSQASVRRHSPESADVSHNLHRPGRSSSGRKPPDKPISRSCCD